MKKKILQLPSWSKLWKTDKASESHRECSNYESSFYEAIYTDVGHSDIDIFHHNWVMQ
jgi:hypothetical protein